MTQVPNLGQEIVTHDQSMDLIKATYRTELDVLMEQAKCYPRDMPLRLKDATVIATSSIAIAEACFYKKPTGGSEKIEGPSVRLAEIVAMCWGNMMVDVKTQMITDREVIARGMGMDCQTGFGVSLEARMGILDRHGERYADHMVTTTAMAACSIAYRNIVFRLVPAALIQPIYLAVKEAAIGEGAKFEKRRKEVVERLQANLGVSTARILLAVQAEEIDQITPNQLETLIGFGTAIHNGDVQTDEVFPPPGASGTDQLNEALKSHVPKGGKKSDEAQSSSKSAPVEGSQGLDSPASSDEIVATALEDSKPVGNDEHIVKAQLEPFMHPEAAAIANGTEPNSGFGKVKPEQDLDETLNGALDGNGSEGGAKPKGPPILDQMIDWFAGRAEVKTHDAFKRLQEYAKSVYDKDINIQQMSDRALNAYWKHLKKMVPELIA